MNRTLFFTLAGILLLTASCSEKQLTLNVMSFNVRYDNPEDAENYWPYRKDFATNMIHFYDVDVLGTQEVTYTQLNDILSALPYFSYIGVARDDGKTSGEYSAIFYKTDKFELLEGNTFWLSEDPSAVGVKGWDANCVRVVTWAVFRDKSTGKKFAFFNTHFDHRGEVARVESAKLLVRKVDELSKGLPVIITGDFNAVPESEPVMIITDESRDLVLKDTRSLAAQVYGPAWTAHSFGRTPLENRRIIDYIFVNDRVKVEKYAVIAEMLDTTYLSDHAPVLVKLEL